MSSSTPRFIHCNDIDGVRYTWDVRRLWTLAAGLPVEHIPVGSVSAVNENVWFHEGEAPTVRNVVAHIKRVLAASTAHPIILNVDGSVMDGLHRVARAMLEGRETIAAVRFTTMPPAQSAEPIQKPL